MARVKSKGAPPQVFPWRTDVAWPQDVEPLLSVIDENAIAERVDLLRKAGIAVSEKSKRGVENALQSNGALEKLLNPQAGALSLAAAMVSLHPAGIDRDHLL